MDDHRAVLRLSFALFLVQAGFQSFTATLPLALAAAGRNDAEIGVLVGIAALVQIGGALAGGALTDRFGGLRLFAVGAGCYLAACALMFIVGASDLTGAGAGAALALIAARVLQGAGFGFTVPPVLSIVPTLVPVERRGTAIAVTGTMNSMTLVAIPPVSLVVLDRFGLGGVAVFAAACVAIGLVLALARPLRRVSAAAETQLGVAARRFGFAYRRSWFGPLAIVVLFVIHWGVVTAYLPQRAEAAGADIGLFFAADGLFVLLARIPAGWLADRFRPVIIVVGGLAMTALGVAILFATPTTPMLMLAGALTGTGAALIIQPLMLALTQRSTDADRGSAFALFSALFAAGIAIGSIGTAPVVDSTGFGPLLAAGLVAIVCSVIVALTDSGLRRKPKRTGADIAESIELVSEAGTPLGP